MQQLPPLDKVLDDVRAEDAVRAESAIRPFDIALVILFGAAAWWRINNLTYNTLFVDEAIYARVGEAFLAGHDPSGALSFMFGSFFYPVLSALATDMGGVFALRLVSAGATLIATLYVFLATRMLFGHTAAFWALFFFAFSGPVVSLGQQAVYDAAALVFLAAAFYYTVRAAHPRHSSVWDGVLAAAGLSVAIFSKYISVIYLPALVVVYLAVRLQHRAAVPFRKLLPALLVMVVLWVPYIGLNRDALQSVFSGQFSTQVVERLEILQALTADIGLVLLLALPGLIMCVVELVKATKLRGLSALRVGIFALVLGVSLFALPLYHLASSNIRALWKHEALALIFLSPLASVIAARLLFVARRAGGRYSFEKRVFAAVLLVVASLWWVRTALVMNNSFHQSWPNVARTLDHLDRRLRLTDQNQVLAAAASVYEYYLFPNQPDPNGWQDTWGFEYNGVWGTEAINQAIADCALDAVILDDFYTPDTADSLRPLLADAGYILDFEDVQVLYSGRPNRIWVYIPGGEQPCGTQSDA